MVVPATQPLQWTTDSEGMHTTTEDGSFSAAIVKSAKPGNWTLMYTAKGNESVTFDTGYLKAAYAQQDAEHIYAHTTRS